MVIQKTSCFGSGIFLNLIVIILVDYAAKINNRYCSFHLGNFKRAEEAYRELLDAHEVTNAVYLYIACCYFYQQMFEEAEKIAEKGNACFSAMTSFIFSYMLCAIFQVRTTR